MSHSRGLPRLFVPEASMAEPIDLPKAEVDKLRKVLRLSAGAEIAVLPNDGSLIRCRFEGSKAVPLAQEFPQTEAPHKLTIAQALPKADKLDEIVRACTEIGVGGFIFFPSDRTVVRWDDAKLESRLSRLATIAREACEVSFRTRLPELSVAQNLEDVLGQECRVLSEVEDVHAVLPLKLESDLTVVVGPEGGWSPREVQQIGDRGVTLGPRVLRVDHAAAAAAAKLLLA